MADKDPQLETKKRARRRLVGAAALALFAAVVLPMVMDAEPKPLTEDIQIRIPNPEATTTLSRPMPMKTATPPGGSPVGSEPAAQPAESAATARTGGEVAVVVEADGGSVRQNREASPDSPALKASAPKTSAKQTPQPGADKPSAGVAAVPPLKPLAPAAGAGVTVPPVPPALLAPPPEAPRPPSAKPTAVEPAPESGTRYVVQLGTFIDVENARRVRAKAKAAGIESYSETLKSPEGEKLRVRAGPFPDRASAEKARATLAERGVSGVVTVKQ